jgi:hypothetical protein
LCTIGNLSPSGAAAETVSTAPEPYVLRSSAYHVEPLGSKELHARCGSDAHVQQKVSGGRSYAVFTYIDDQRKLEQVGLAETREERIPGSQEYRGFSHKFHNGNLIKGLDFHISWKCTPDTLNLH